MTGGRFLSDRRAVVIAAGALMLLQLSPAGGGEWRYDGQSFPGSGSAMGGAGESAPSGADTSGRAENGDGIDVLESKVTESPGDAGLRLRLAQAYAAAGQPTNALASCIRAAEIEPDDIEIRKHCGRYAEWAGDLPASIEQFEALLARAPGDGEGLLGAARAHGWSANLRQAADYYRQYLKLYPDNAEAWIEYAQVRAWQGNFAAALDALEAYRERFGDTTRYREEKARYLAWDNRPREALSINTPLVEGEPDNYEHLYTQAVAQAANKETDEALRTVEKLEQLRPGSRDSRLLARVVRAPTRSRVTAGWHYYDDSDSIEIQGARAEARLQLTSRAALSTGGSYNTLRADAGSGFRTIEGRERIRYTQAWIGGSYRFNPAVAVSGKVGSTDIRGGEDFVPYEIDFDLRPGDDVELSLLRRRELYALSPRAVSLGITRDHNALAVNWRPGYRYTVESTLSYDELSDGNNRQELVVAPRRAVLRTGALNADLGAHFNWMAFDEELDNGYYDPERYQRYAATLFGYGKLSEDNGLSVVATAGFHKDEEMTDFEFGYDIVGELTVGLYEDWMSVLRVDYSDRYQETGSYDGWNANLNVTRRF